MKNKRLAVHIDPQPCSVGLHTVLLSEHLPSELTDFLSHLCRRGVLDAKDPHFLPEPFDEHSVITHQAVLRTADVAQFVGKRLALPDVNVTKVGSQAWLRDQYGLGVADVVNAVKDIVK